MSKPTKATFEPDYEGECVICGQTPTVVIISKEGNAKMSTHMEMCGACCFGEAKCINPDEWR